MKPFGHLGFGLGKLSGGGGGGTALTFYTESPTLTLSADTYTQTSSSGGNVNRMSVLQQGVDSGRGKGYLELKINTWTTGEVLCIGGNEDFSQSSYNFYVTHNSAGATYNWGFKATGAGYFEQTNTAAASTLYDMGIAATGEIWAVCFDFDNGRSYFGSDDGGAAIIWADRPNGTTHVPPSDPTVDTGNFANILAETPGLFHLAVSHYKQGTSFTVNVGQSAFSYTPPTGYVAYNLLTFG